MRDNRRLFWWSFFIAAIAVMFGWATAKDAEDVRVCREAVTAINRADSLISIRRVTATSFSRNIRIDYDVRYAERSRALSRYTICRFSPGLVPPFQSDLSGVITEFGPLPDSKLFLLKRFYIGTAEAERAVGIDQNATMSGPRRFITHIIEWSLNVAPRAAIYLLIAMAFTGMLYLFRSLRPSMFYGIGSAVASFAGALAVTGPVSTIAISLAFMTGIIGGVCTIVLYKHGGNVTSKAGNSLFSWFLAAALVLVAPFWFPGNGIFTRHWLPLAWTRPLSLMEIDGYDISVTPLALATIIASGMAMAAVHTFFRQQSSDAPHMREASMLEGLFALLSFAFVSGGAAALGYVQYGLETDPLLLCSKGLFIALIINMSGSRFRLIYALVLCLALASLELALAPILTRSTIHLFAYGLLAVALISQPEFRAILSLKEKAP